MCSLENVSAHAHCSERNHQPAPGQQLYYYGNYVYKQSTERLLI